jgi:ketosteroid isomerase-like protein
MQGMTLLRRSVLALPAAVALAQNSPAAAEVRRTVDAFFAAVTKNDVAAAGRFLAEDLIYTHSTGIAESKSEYLAKLRAGTQKYTSLDLVQPVIRVFGDAAVLNTQIRMQGASKGVPFDNTLFMMQVWVKQGGAWKMVAHQTTRKP